MIKIMLVDDEKLLRDSLGYILSTEKDIHVVAMVENGIEAIKMCQEHKPDLVLMDIEMPGGDGVTATRKIKEKCPDTKIIILTTFENPDNIMEAFIAKADGYIVKDIRQGDLIYTIRCVVAGLTVIHDSVRNIMVNRFKGLMDRQSVYADVLNERDTEIIKLIAKGQTNKEIGGELGYSEGTIKNNISRLLVKLDMTDRMQIAIFAMENGIM